MKATEVAAAVEEAAEAEMAEVLACGSEVRCRSHYSSRQYVTERFVARWHAVKRLAAAW